MATIDPDTGEVLERFERLLALDGEARSRELERLKREEPPIARELETLLAFDAAGGGFLTVPGVGEGPADADGWLPVGTRVGPYEVRAPIGRGGMGAVYLAERVEDFRRPVALKLIRPDPAGRFAARFHAERQILATLDHPGIVRLLDGGTDARGTPYLAMEFVDGHHLDDYCESFDVPRDERVGLVHEVALAVAYAQDREILHRDLKPSNILVGPGRAPKVTDFGLARLVSAEVGATNDQGTLLGTVGYMAPEQVVGGPGRNGTGVDVYALGVVLYRLIAGRLPFEPGPAARWLVNAVNEEPPPPGRFAEVPRDLETIVMKAIARDPAERIATAGALAEQLRRYLAGEPLTIRPASPLERLGKWSRRRGKALAAWGASFAAALLVMIGLLVTWNRSLSRDRDALWLTMQGLGRSTLKLVEDAPPGDPASFRFFEEMVRSFDAALEGGQVARGPSVARQAALMHRHLAMELIVRDRPAEALPHLDRAMNLLRLLPGHFADPEARIWVRFDVFRCVKDRSTACNLLGDPSRALAETQEALGLIAGLVRDQPGEPAWVEAQARLHCDRSLLLTRLGRDEEAQGEARQAAEMADRALSATPDDLVRLNTAVAARTRLGRLIEAAGDAEEAEALLRSSLDLAVRMDESHPDSWSASAARVHALHNLGSFLLERGRRDEARPLLDQALSINRGLLGRSPDNGPLRGTRDYLIELLGAYPEGGGPASP